MTRDSNYQTNMDTTPKKTTCYACLREFTSFNRYADICEECDSKRKAEDLERSKKNNRDKILSRLPPLFKATDINHAKFNGKAWSKIKEHKLTEEKPWLGLVGMTGRCKSRLAYLYAREEIIRSAGLWDNRDREFIPSFEFVTSYQIGEAVLRQYGEDKQAKREAREFLDTIRATEVLLVDDIGKGRLTPAVAGELFALVDHRHANLLRTIWTSNTDPEVIAEGLTEDMAGPFAGRLIDSSTIFTFK